MTTAVLAPGELALLSAASNKQHAFARLWVRKEAAVKFGRGSLDDLSALDFSALPMVNLSSGRQCVHRWQGQFLLEWQHPKGEVVGAAVTTHAPDFAVFGESHGASG